MKWDEDNIRFLKNKYPRVIIEGNNLECFEFIQNKLENDFGIKSNIYIDKKCYKMQIDKDSYKLIQLMFKNPKIYLDRKFEKVKEIIQAVHNRNIMNN